MGLADSLKIMVTNAYQLLTGSRGLDGAPVADVGKYNVRRVALVWAVGGWVGGWIRIRPILRSPGDQRPIVIHPHHHPQHYRNNTTSDPPTH